MKLDRLGYPEPRVVFGSLSRLYEEAQFDAPPMDEHQWMEVDGVRYVGKAMIEKLKTMDGYQ